MMTAADEDRFIPRNPCRIRGAGSEHAPERPVLTVAQVFSPAELVGRRPIGNVRRLPDGSYRLRYQLAGQMKALPEVYPSKSDADGALWASWNPGTPPTVTTRGTGHSSCSPLSAASDGAEVTALRRCDIDLAAGSVRVHAAVAERSNGEIVLGRPNPQRADAW
jgi:hypothetical protein